MKRILFVVAFIVAEFGNANAQPSEKVVIGAGIRVGLPVNDFKAFASFGIGGELQGEYKFSNIISGIGTTGYTSFLGKDYGDGKTKSTGYIPILAGARMYPVKRFFIGAQIGYGILTSGSNSDGGFNYQPQVGYNASKFQFALNYNTLSIDGAAFSHIGFTGVFKFNSRK